MSQQQSQQPDHSTLVQASSLSSDDQSSTDDSQTSALHNTSGQSTTGQMHRMAIQSTTQSGIRHILLNTVQQPVNHQQQHPEPSMNQQFSVQQIEQTQQFLPQPATGELSNLHPNQTNNLLNQHETQDCMQPQHQEYAAFHSEDNIWESAQPSPSHIEFSGNKDFNFLLTFPLLNPCSQPFMVPEDQDIPECEMNINNSGDIQPPQPFLANFEFSKEDDTLQYLQDQEMNISDEVANSHSSLHPPSPQIIFFVSNTVGVPLPPPQKDGLAAMEVPIHRGLQLYHPGR